MGCPSSSVDCPPPNHRIPCFLQLVAMPRSPLFLHLCHSTSAVIRPPTNIPSSSLLPWPMSLSSVSVAPDALLLTSERGEWETKSSVIVKPSSRKGGGRMAQGGRRGASSLYTVTMDNQTSASSSLRQWTMRLQPRCPTARVFKIARMQGHVIVPPPPPSSS